MLRILLILLLLISIPDCYIYWMYLRDTPSPWRLALLLLPTLGALSCMALFLCRVEVPGLLQITFALLLCIAVPKLTFVLADLLGRGKQLSALFLFHRIYSFQYGGCERMTKCVTMLCPKDKIYQSSDGSGPDIIGILNNCQSSAMFRRLRWMVR